MMINTKLYSMQVNVPHSEYGECKYFMPKILADWLNGYELQYQLTGYTSGGNGYTNGVTNKESHYMVSNITEVDGVAFQIQFPKCRVFISKQYDYA